MTRRDAAVDDTDDDIFAPQPEVPAQAALGRRKAEKARTGVGLYEFRPVLPDVANVLAGAEFAGLGRVEARGNAV